MVQYYDHLTKLIFSIHCHYVRFAGVQGQAVWQELLYYVWKIPILSAWPRACLVFSTVRPHLPLRSMCMLSITGENGLSPPVSVFPVKPVHLALYLQYLGDTKQSRAAVEEATYFVA